MEDDRSAFESAADEVTEAGSAASPGESRFGDAKPGPAAGKKRHDRPFYFKRYGARPVLLALFVIMLVGAFLLYPRRSAVYRAGSAFVHVYTTGTVESIYTSLDLAVSTPGEIPGFDASLVLTVSMPPKIVTRPVSILYIPLSAGVTPENCGQAQGCTFHSGLLTVRAVFRPAQPSSGRRVWVDSTYIIFAGRVLPWEANGLDVEAQLPVISISPLSELPGFKPQPWAPSKPKCHDRLLCSGSRELRLDWRPSTICRAKPPL
jgi:hypothetical protein